MEENKIQEMNVNVVNDTGFADPSPVLPHCVFHSGQIQWGFLERAQYLESECCS